MSSVRDFVSVDEQGAIWVGECRAPLESIVIAFMAGDNIKSVHEQYPALTTEEIVGAWEYWKAYPSEVEQYMQRQAALWEHWKKQSEEHPSPARERLRQLKRNRTK